MIDDWLNIPLMKNPLNWIIVLLMVTLAMLPFALLHERVHGTPGAK